jgi:hypothetical protein
MNRFLLSLFVVLACSVLSVHAADRTSLSTAGVIESKSGWFRFPDGTTQLTAVAPACTVISTVPYVISTAGVYCFAGNLEFESTSGSAIQVNTDNVVIDLGGWTLDGTTAGSGTLAKGIYGYQRRNITVRNGTVRGFFEGVQLEDNIPPHDTSMGHIVENLRMDQIYKAGLRIDGRGNIIRENLVINTGNTTADSANKNTAFGIHIRGPAARVLDNEIVSVQTGTDPFGLTINSAHGSVAEGNRIHDLDGTNGYGIRIEDSDDVFIVNNRVSAVENAISFINSIGKYRDNLTSNVTTAYSGGTDAGGND